MESTTTTTINSSTWIAFREATTNATSYLVPSPKDLLMVVPRMASRAGTFVTEAIPGAFENIFGGGITGRTIAEATVERAGIAPIISATEVPITAAANLPVETATSNSSVIQALTFSQLRTLGGMLSYLTSKWGLGWFAAYIILNRTSIYAAPRRHVRLGWQLEAALRIVPILLLVNLAGNLLRALRCQMSPEYPMMRYGSEDKSIVLDFAAEGGFFYNLASSLLFWESEVSSCSAIGMIPTIKDSNPSGSFSFLWPAFLTFCFAQFVETLSCAVQGITVYSENGMSLFEHSLAFAEAEALVGGQITFSGTESKQVAKLLSIKNATKQDSLLPLRGLLLTPFNTRPEVLIMTLISTLKNLTGHILAIFGVQAKYRLVNTTVWALCFLASFIWGLQTMSLEESLEVGLFRFPTVCVVVFIPHLLILTGIICCSLIYGIALVLSVIAPANRTNASWTEKFKKAHQNMQANMHLSGIKFRMNEDFYTALVKIGFTILSAASEAVFLHEGRHVNVGQWTWLEEERMSEILLLENKNTEKKSLNTLFVDEDIISQPSNWKSGYAIEHNTKLLKERAATSGSKSGIGPNPQEKRFMVAFNFLVKIFWLLFGWLVLAVVRLLSAIGIKWRPNWVRRLLASTRADIDAQTNQMPRPKELEFWLLTDEGEIMLPKDNNVDVALEMKKRLQVSTRMIGQDIEPELDAQTYSWFKNGGWWGELDHSGDYQPSLIDDDTTSTISVSDISDASGWESESSGRQTPTQQDQNPSRETTLDTTYLASLLNPHTAEERSEARLLGARLSRNGPLTRSQYSRLSSSVLTSTNYRPNNFKPMDPSGKLTPHEEAEILESLIIRFRENKRKVDSTNSWSEGADGLGAGGPMCVVCQTSPRTILSWPCRCLSLCEDCRVSLAMNNFGTCVCCRQEVAGFSRLFVP
jgi:hypothetical protein